MFSVAIPSEMKGLIFIHHHYLHVMSIRAKHQQWFSVVIIAVLTRYCLPDVVQKACCISENREQEQVESYKPSFFSICHLGEKYSIFVLSEKVLQEFNMTC